MENVKRWEPRERYEIRAEIGSGGMAVVYRARDHFAQREVALKRLLPECVEDARHVALFRREFDTLARLRHPNIVEAFDFGADGYGSFYTMELLEGRPVASLTTPSVRDGCRLIRDVASALSLVHARRWVHRDVSPRNIIATKSGHIKLIDFGALAPFGAARELVGTPAFTAPESLSGGPLDQRTDLYSLGALAYWMLTGRLHVRARHFTDLPEEWSAPLVPPSRYLQTIPRVLDELICALLSIDPLARPSSAAEVVSRLVEISVLGPEEDEARVALSYLQHSPLHGREQALSVLSEATEAALRGNGQAVIIESERGLGRTALLDHVSIHTQLMGATVLRVDGSSANSRFGAARRLTEAGLGIYPSIAKGIYQRSSSLYSLISKSSDNARMVSGVDVTERHSQVSSELSEALLAISDRSPLVLLIDDAHAIDADTLGLFAALVDVIATRRIVLVLTCLAGRSSPFPEAFAQLRRHARLVRLAALEEADLDRLMGTTFGEADHAAQLATWLYAQTGGNPAQCFEHLRLLLSDGAIRYTSGTFVLPLVLNERGPNALHASLSLSSLAGVSQNAYALVQLLALHEGELTLDQLVVASGQSVREVVLALRELVDRAAVSTNGMAATCRSEALRTALVSAWTPQDKGRAHLALARALDAQGRTMVLDSFVAASWHLMRSGGAEATLGARRLAGLPPMHQFELAASKADHRALEEAYEILVSTGLPDEECLAILVPLSLAALSGQIAVQRRYAERTLHVLARVSGLSRAKRLAPYLGIKFAVLLGLGATYLSFCVRRRARSGRSYVQNIYDLCMISAGASGALASVLDFHGSWALAHWLAPFAGLSPTNAPALLYELSRATAELARGLIRPSLARFQSVSSILNQPTPRVPERLREQLRFGALLGRAQALATDADPRVLPIASELETGRAFFAAHAEGVRATYFAYRGEVEEAEAHRRRAQDLAFRSGMWPVLTMMTMRWVYACALTGDVVRLVRAVDDMQRLAHLSSGMSATSELALAHLESLRGHPDRAIHVYDRILSSDTSCHMPTYAVERAFQARALLALGDHARARDLCTALAQEVAITGHDSVVSRTLCAINLSLAQAALGEHESSASTLEGAFVTASRHGNPLWMGLWHQARAQTSACAGRRAQALEHFLTMRSLFRSTRNPCLIQQAEHFQADLNRMGVDIDHGASGAEDVDRQRGLADSDTTDLVRGAGEAG